jgi:hypothetical protein
VQKDAIDHNTTSAVLSIRSGRKFLEWSESRNNSASITDLTNHTASYPMSAIAWIVVICWGGLMPKQWNVITRAKLIGNLAKGDPTG